MANLLNRNDKHIFLEKPSKVSGSFIAAINILRKHLEELLAIASKINDITASVEAAEAIKIQIKEIKEIYELVKLISTQAVADIILEGNKQVLRLEGIAELQSLVHGLSCAEATWRVEQTLFPGDTVTLPEELRFVVGRHHLRLSCDGQILNRLQFREIGDIDSISNKICFNEQINVGSYITAWVVPLGSTDINNIVGALNNRITDLEAAFVDLSRRVVYADKEE